MFLRVNSQSTVRLVLASASLLMIAYVFVDTRMHVKTGFLTCKTPDNMVCTPKLEKAEIDVYDVSKYVNGPPTESVFDNLRNDTRYLTGFLNAGWTNDVMTIVNMIYLAVLSDRVPVVPPHVPMHVGLEANDFIFSEIFDLPRLRETIKWPIIEWKDLKTGIHQDRIGCWTTWKTASPDHQGARGSRLQHSLHLDISYNTVPDSTKLLNLHNSFWGLAKLSFPEGYKEAVGQTQTLPSGQHKVLIKPNDHLMCFDLLYYLAAHDAYEWEQTFSPAWRYVGKHLHFHPRMIGIAEDYLHRAFGLDPAEIIPPFIAVHMRRGDFSWECNNNKNTCFPPPRIIAEYVTNMQNALLTERQISVTHVLVTSDEKDAEFWAEIAARGWHYIDHAKEKTSEILGKWYEPFIDGMHQSMGVGFIGTEGSTMSLVALRRTVDWNSGIGKMIPFAKDMYPEQS